MKIRTIEPDRHDMTDVFEDAISAALQDGTGVHLLPGRHRITRALRFSAAECQRIAITGCGPGISVLVCDNCDGPSFAFAQDLLSQRGGLIAMNFSIAASGKCGTGLAVSYGEPFVTQDHYRSSLLFRDLAVESSDAGSFAHGIDIESAWNVTLDNVFCSGDTSRITAGNWNGLRGRGITFRRSCVNVHLSNVRTNFFETGLHVHARNSHNTEGIFCQNCSMVGVGIGVWIKGNPHYQIGDNAVPRISTFTWTGGLIECRVGGSAGLRAAIFLEHVWTALITGAQFLAEKVPVQGTDAHPTYGVLLAHTNGAVINACDINAWNYGIHTAGPCLGISANACTFTNVEKQVIFAPGTTASRSGGHVRVNNTPFEWSDDNSNPMNLS
jgi:hypothetical protein